MLRDAPVVPGSNRLLGPALFLLAFGAMLLVASLVLGSHASPLVQSVAERMQMPVPWVLGVGLLLVVAHAALRSRAAPPAPAGEPVFIPADSTDFARSAVQVEPESPANPLRRAPRPPANGWCLQVFDDIEWKRFETLCAELFAQAGFEARTESHGADGGVDIWLHSRNAVGPVAIVQCKHWLTRPVDVKEVREVLAVMAAEKVTRGTLVTTSRFTAEAEQFARENNINLLDVQGLLALVAKRTPEQQQALLQHAYEGEYWRPTCASCGIRMVERTARQGASAFWGCANYPRCRFTLPMRVAA